MLNNNLEKQSVYVFDGECDDIEEITEFVKNVLIELKSNDYSNFRELLSWFASVPGDSDTVVEQIMEEESVYNVWLRLTEIGVIAVPVPYIGESKIYIE